MKATEILENEHRVIEQVLSCLERMADLNEHYDAIDCETAREMIEFFRMFADGFHHAKEEQHFFVAMEACGMPREGGPTGVMLAEHEMGRNFTAAMEKAVNAYIKGDHSSVKDFAAAARSYVSLLREHIQKEDHCLFAMANENLTAEQQDQLLEAFRAEEVKLLSGKGADFYLKKAQALAERFQIRDGIAGDREASCCGTGGCSNH